MDGKFSILYPSDAHGLVVYIEQNLDDECTTQGEP